MTSNLVLTPTQRQELLHLYRKHEDPEVRFRVHILLLLADGHTWETVAALLYCSSRTIDRWVKRFQEEGLDGLSGRRRGRPFRFAAVWVRLVAAMVLRLSPRDFGWLRSRWTCALLALAVKGRFDVGVSRETVRRWLQRGQMVYRRPRPIRGPSDAERETKLA